MTREVIEQVRNRAQNRCEYCHLPQAAYRRPFHIEHITARQHGGQTDPDNLALACWYCNFKKGPNLTGIDPITGALVRLFHPRLDSWADHFQVIAISEAPARLEISGITPSGRATVRVLGMNEHMRCILRHELWREGVFNL